jgi:hypothetical protein
VAQNEPKNIRFLATRWHSLNRNQWHKPLLNRWHKTNQNSQYQGINFFEFLKSGEMSIFEYQKK